MRPRPSRTARLRRALPRLALVVLAMAGCSRPVPVAGANDPKPADDAPPPLPKYVLVAVQNHNWNDVVIWVSRNGQLTRLGTVTATSDATLRFPGEFIAASTQLQLVARPVGGREEYRSERFVVQPGQHVAWTLESELRRSSLSVH